MADATIVSAGVHYHWSQSWVREVLHTVPNVLWATSTAIHLERLPSLLAMPGMPNATVLIDQHSQSAAFHAATAGLAAAERRWSASGAPWVDTYAAVASCPWADCTIDGGHMSRFVCRMKAHLLLNRLCYFRSPALRVPANYQ